MSVISGGGVAPLHNPLPDLVLLRVEVEVDLPLGLEHHLTGTDGTRLFVGETHHGHHVSNLVELLEHVHLQCLLDNKKQGWKFSLSGKRKCLLSHGIQSCD